MANSSINNVRFFNLKLIIANEAQQVEINIFSLRLRNTVLGSSRVNLTSSGEAACLALVDCNSSVYHSLNSPTNSHLKVDKSFQNWYYSGRSKIA